MLCKTTRFRPGIKMTSLCDNPHKTMQITCSFFSSLKTQIFTGHTEMWTVEILSKLLKMCFYVSNRIRAGVLKTTRKSFSMFAVLWNNSRNVITLHRLLQVHARLARSSSVLLCYFAFRKLKSFQNEFQLRGYRVFVGEYWLFTHLSGVKLAKLSLRQSFIKHVSVSSIWKKCCGDNNNKMISIDSELLFIVFKQYRGWRSTGFVED